MSGVIQKYDRTENLFDAKLLRNNKNLNPTSGLPYNYDGRIANTAGNLYNNVTTATLTFSVVGITTTEVKVIYSVFNDTTLVRRVSNVSNGDTLDLSNGNKLYICFYSNVDITTSNISNLMLNTGSTALPYQPYLAFKDIPYTRLETATDTITALPKTIYTDTTSIPSANLLNPESTVELDGVTHYGQSFPAGTYYIYNGAEDSVQNYITYSDDFESSIYALNGGSGTIFTATNTLILFVTNKDVLRVSMVAKSSKAVPFTPYTGDYTIKSNMQHTGTPTPSNPVEVNGVGERTENLFNEVYPNISSNVLKVEISVPNGEYTLSTTAPLNNNDGANLFLLKGNDSPSTSGNGVWNEQTRTITITDGVLKIGYRSIQGVNPENYKTMLNVGNTDKPYEPYGYKIPIVSGNTTTNIYLSEPLRSYLGHTDTIDSNGTVTRRIKKKVFTGEEPVNGVRLTFDENNYCASYRFDAIGMEDIIDYEEKMTAISYPKYMSTHFVNKNDTYQLYYTIYDGQMGANDSGSTGNARNRYITFCVAGLTTDADYQAWFAQQYANGTPVEVYYILAIPTTETITAPSIPTTSGGQTFDVATTLKPSEVDLTYHGWHEHEAEKRENGQWV